MEIASGVFDKLHTTGGIRRGPRINTVSSGMHMNLRRADSCCAVGTWYSGGLACLGCFSMTDLRPRGRRAVSTLSSPLPETCGQHTILQTDI